MIGFLSNGDGSFRIPKRNSKNVYSEHLGRVRGYNSFKNDNSKLMASKIDYYEKRSNNLNLSDSKRLYAFGFLDGVFEPNGKYSKKRVIASFSYIKKKNKK